MKAIRTTAAELLNNEVLIGAITIIVVALAVYLSYIAENGLPFVATYNINVDVPNADELIKNADVRIGGARVGQVLTITPEPASRSWPHPYAQLGLALQSSLNPLPTDTHYQVRLASVLGGKYLEIIPGRRRGSGLPDGGTFALSTDPRLNHNIPFVDLDTALATFGPKTRSSFRAAIGELGDVVAGRGAQFNDSIRELALLIGPLGHLLGVLADPATNLAGLLSGLHSTTSALAPVAATLDSLLTHAATTFHALDLPELGQTIDGLPPTETLGTTVLTNAQPVLGDAAALVEALKPPAALLPLASNRLADIITSATPVFQHVPPLAANLERTLRTVNGVALDPASSETFRVLGSNDLATFGSSAFIGLGAVLRSVAQAQFSCNAAALWVRNFQGALEEGDSTGGWLRFAPILDPAQIVASAKPAADLHLNPYPAEDPTQCQAGNEGYSGTQLIGSPPRTSTHVDNTQPPPGVLAEGRKAGLVP